MNNLGRVIALVVAVGAFPAAAKDNVRTAAPANSDVTGTISSEPRDPTQAAPVSPSSGEEVQTKPVVSYAEAYRNWRTCAAEHQGVGNPPPQCEDLRLALREAIGARPRNQAQAQR